MFPGAKLTETIELAGQIAGSRVLVTGGSGFIGAHLCHRLSNLRAKVHAVSRKMHPSDSEHLRWWQADLRDFQAVQKVVRAVQPELVFHLASHVDGARDVTLVLPTFHDNLTSTVHLLTSLAETGCGRIVLACSSEEPLAGSSKTFARSPYAAAKWASSIYGRMFSELFKLPIVMPRIFMTYGPDQKDTQKLVPFVILSLLRDEIPKLSSGQRRADWIYVDDVVEGLLRAAVVPGIEGSSFDLGTGILVSVREIAERIAQLVDATTLLTFGSLPDRPFEQERSADTFFLLERLGYQPNTSWQLGLEATVTWYREQLLEESRRGVAHAVI